MAPGAWFWASLYVIVELAQPCSAQVLSPHASLNSKEEFRGGRPLHSSCQEERTSFSASSRTSFSASSSCESANKLLFVEKLVR